MSINFCDTALKPVFSCLQPSHEGYDVTNLASENYTDRQKGFLAYCFPPVTVNVTFLCSVKIRHIVIWPQVLSQKSLGLEILVRSAGKRKQLWQSCGSSQLNLPPVTYVGQDDNFHRVGSILLSTTDAGVVFSKHDLNSSAVCLQPKFAQKSLFRDNTLENVDSVQIKIFKTASSAPALRKVEVWGEPGLCSRKISRSVSELWSNRSHINSKTLTIVSESKVSLIQTSDATIAPDCVIPEEFLDSLTCNIMSLPFILPSGKIVDNVTLEKHRAYEAMYGRAPSDPFTGVLFTQNYSPVPDHDLKRRIDSFLVANSHRQELRNVPRTTGTVRQPGTTSVHKSSQYNRLIGLPIGEDIVQESSYKNSCSLNTLVSVPSSRAAKRFPETAVNDVEIVKRVKGNDATTTSSVSNSEPTQFAFAENVSKFCVSASKIKKEMCSKTHDEKLEDSLQTAIKLALSGRPTYVDFNSTTTLSPLQIKPHSCIGCSKCETLYALPCKHLLCRDCLVSKKDSKPSVCTICHMTYQSCNVTKFHS